MYRKARSQASGFCHLGVFYLDSSTDLYGNTWHDNWYYKNDSSTLLWGRVTSGSLWNLSKHRYHSQVFTIPWRLCNCLCFPGQTDLQVFWMPHVFTGHLTVLDLSVSAKWSDQGSVQQQTEEQWSRKSKTNRQMIPSLMIKEHQRLETPLINQCRHTQYIL